RLERVPLQLHLCLFQAASTLVVIAVVASTDHIGPDVSPTPMARNHVVYRQVLPVQTAVLAGELIPDKDFPAGEPHPRPRSLDQALETNHRGDPNFAGR